MANGVYIPMSAAVAAAAQLEVTANNLANVNTAGFKQTRTAFEAHLVDAGANTESEKGFTTLAETKTDMSLGTIRATQNPLDMAISGPGFFMVRTPQGDMLTRAGSFRLGADGTLLDPEGNSVLGGGAEGQATPIVVPSEGGPVSIGGGGELVQAGTEIARLSIVNVNPEDLTRVGNANFTADAAALAPVDPTTTTVLGGHIEDSNVNPLRGMIDLIDVSRNYETSFRVMSRYRKIDDKTLAIV